MCKLSIHYRFSIDCHFLSKVNMWQLKTLQISFQKVNFGRFFTTVFVEIDLQSPWLTLRKFTSWHFLKFTVSSERLFCFFLESTELRIFASSLRHPTASMTSSLILEAVNGSQFVGKQTRRSTGKNSKFHSPVRSCRKIQLQRLVAGIIVCGWTWRRRRQRVFTCHDELPFSTTKTGLTTNFFLCFCFRIRSSGSDFLLEPPESFQAEGRLQDHLASVPQLPQNDERVGRLRAGSCGAARK